MTSSERMLKLMAYADGELDEGERAEVEKLLATDAEAAKVVAQMGALGEVVRAVNPPLPEVDLVSAIMEKVEHEKIEPARVTTPPPMAKVVPLASRRRWGAVAVAALALAASVFVMTRQKTEAPLAQNTKPAPVETATNPAPANAVNASSGPGVEVEAVESPGQSVSVFYLPTANELSTSVTVWVDETGENK